MALVDAGGEPVSRLALTEIATQRASRRIGGKGRRSVDAHVCELRRRLGDSADQPKIIVTIPKVGYAIDM
jgi:DNA-binding winged helix-turn-helix (wHTH) protein